jgi:hypothetical protein
VHTSRDPKELLAKLAPEHPLHRLVIIDLVWCETEAHARRIKTRLDVSLLGDDQQNRLQWSWRDMPEPSLAWPILLNEAIMSIMEQEQIEVFDDDERRQRIERAKYR